MEWILAINPDMPSELRDFSQRAAGVPLRRVQDGRRRRRSESVFGMIGGLLGVAIFKKNTPRSPEPGTVEVLPPAYGEPIFQSGFVTSRLVVEGAMPPITIFGDCMSEIAALLQEHRRFPPSEELERNATIADPGIYERAARDPEAFWAGLRAELEWIEPWTEVLRLEAAARRMVRRRQAQRRASTASIATCARPRRNKAAIIWEGEPGDRRTLTYWDLYRQVGAVRERPEVARRQTRRSRRALPAADSRARHCDARVRAHRRGAQRGLRRLQRGVAARPHQRRAGRPARDR